MSNSDASRRNTWFSPFAGAAFFGATLLSVSLPANAAPPNPGPEGSWLYTVTIPASKGTPRTVFQGVETYAGGGGYSEADQLSFTPGYLATAGHGAWVANGPRLFTLTYVNLTYARGKATGSSKVRQVALLGATGDTYSGHGDFTYYDANGNAIPGASGPFTIKATKIAIEKPQ